MKKKINFQIICFQILLFLYIYSPPFRIVPLGVAKFISLGCIIGLFFLFYKTTLKVISYKFLALHLILFFLAVSYAFIQDFFVYNSDNISFSESNFYQQLLILVEVLPISLFFSLFCRKKLKFNYYDLLQSFVNIGIVQSFVCLVMLVLPGLRAYILGSLLEYEEVEQRFLSVGTYGNYRGFGIGIGYEFSLSVFQGFALAFICLLCFHNFKKYAYLLLFTPFLVLSIVLNARIGLWVFAGFVALAAVFYLSRFPLAAIIKNTLIISLISFVASIIFVNVSSWEVINNNIDWLVKSYTQTVEFLEGNGDQGTLYILANKHIHFPDNLESLFFGEGRYVFGEIATSNKIRSDIGYIRNIYFGGYIYLFLLFSSLTVLFWSGFRIQKQPLLKLLMGFLFVACAVAHIKGNIFSSNPGYRAVYLLFVFAIVDRCIARRENKKKKILSFFHAPSLFTYK